MLNITSRIFKWYCLAQYSYPRHSGEGKGMLSWKENPFDWIVVFITWNIVLYTTRLNTLSIMKNAKEILLFTCILKPEGQNQQNLDKDQDKVVQLHFADLSQFCLNVCLLYTKKSMSVLCNILTTCSNGQKSPVYTCKQFLTSLPNRQVGLGLMGLDKTFPCRV